MLDGLHTLVLPALRHKPHPSHATLEQAIEWARRIGARQTWLTHIAHELGHEQTNPTLPFGVSLAWDGLEVSVSLGQAGSARMTAVYRSLGSTRMRRFDLIPGETARTIPFRARR